MSECIATSQSRPLAYRYERRTPSNSNPARSAVRREAVLSTSVGRPSRTRLSGGPSAQALEQAHGGGREPAPTRAGSDPVADLRAAMPERGRREPDRADWRWLADRHDRQVKSLASLAHARLSLDPRPRLAHVLGLGKRGKPPDLGIATRLVHSCRVLGHERSQGHEIVCEVARERQRGHDLTVAVAVVPGRDAVAPIYAFESRFGPLT